MKTLCELWDDPRLAIWCGGVLFSGALVALSQQRYGVAALFFVISIGGTLAGWRKSPPT